MPHWSDPLEMAKDAGESCALPLFLLASLTFRCFFRFALASPLLHLPPPIATSRWIAPVIYIRCTQKALPSDVGTVLLGNNHPASI